MALIDGDWPLARLRRSAIINPGFVLPLGLRQAVQHRCGGRRMLGAEGDRIGLERQEPPGMVAHFVFVALPLRRFRNEEFPNTGFVTQAHRVAPAVPDVEVADDTDVMRVWRPA